VADPCNEKNTIDVIGSTCSIMQMDTDPKSPRQPGDNIQIMEQLCLPFTNPKMSILKVRCFSIADQQM
jgi:hypothetical protein